LVKCEVSAEDSIEEIVSIEAKFGKDLLEVLTVEDVFLFVLLVYSFEACGVVLASLLGVGEYGVSL